ncbi:MAG: tryptophan synthase subunit alpha [Litoreibacter sp.]
MMESDLTIPTRFEQVFETCSAENRTALSIFISGGDPDLETSLEILKALPEAGADFIELGMPFTDPVADGISVQLAGQRALAAGSTLTKVIDMVREFRKVNDHTPIVLMGYYNPIYSRGNDAFLAEAKEAGVDGLIVADVPPEEDSEIWMKALAAGIAPIRFITPSTHEDRLEYVLKNTAGFLYFVSVAGITGSGLKAQDDISERIATLRRYTDLPVALGFGVKTAADVSSMGAMADAVIVGSRVVDAIKNSLDENGTATAGTVAAVTDLVTELRTGVARK